MENLSEQASFNAEVNNGLILKLANFFARDPILGIEKNYWLEVPFDLDNKQAQDEYDDCGGKLEDDLQKGFFSKVLAIDEWLVAVKGAKLLYQNPAL